MTLWNRTCAAFLVIVAFVLAVTTAVEAAVVTRGPYLQMGSHNRIVVRWRTDVATNSQVSYGLCQGKTGCLSWLSVSATLKTEHEITLTGLSPNTRYYYAVGTTTQILAGNDANHFFVTAPQVGVSKATRIWVLGDSGSATANARAVRDAYYQFTGTRHTDLWLMLGDNAYESGTDAEYQAITTALRQIPAHRLGPTTTCFRCRETPNPAACRPGRRPTFRTITETSISSYWTRSTPLARPRARWQNGFATICSQRIRTGLLPTGTIRPTARAHMTPIRKGFPSRCGRTCCRSSKTSESISS
jgi:Purple acid Phosphatase, N-terminal domain